MDDVMPVLFAAGETRTHLMQWRPSRDSDRPPWVSPCGWAVRREYPDLRDTSHDDEPTRPWCSGCQRIAQRTVNGYLAAGIVERTRPACSTCDGAGQIVMEAQIGAPGSGGTFTCPDCGPTLVERVEEVNG